MSKQVNALGNRSNGFWISITLFLILLLGVLDLLTGYELSFSLFYVLPIALITWFSRRWWGIIASLLSTITWAGADVLSGHEYSVSWLYIWNSLIRLGFFLIISILLSNIKKILEQERDLAHIDSLTGALNSRSFLTQTQEEIIRSRRYDHPITLAFIDVDNFKGINDRFGHSIGDRLLSKIVFTMQKQIRETDSIGRLGGDEFALLMPETGSNESQSAIKRITTHLKQEMEQNEWPVTFSIGVVTCNNPNCNAEELLKKADNLMYSVKRTTKNDFAFSILDN